MTGTINLDGDLAVVEDSGTWIIAQSSDVEQKSDGTWGLVNGASPFGTVSVGTVAAAAVSTEELSVTQGGAARLDMVGTRHSVPSGESVTIPEGYSEVVVGPYDLDGELTVNGRMEIR
jgi:hypothetical protein